MLNMSPMPLICTIVQQGHGRGLGSAWLALTLLLHLLGTWPSSRGVTQEVCCCGLRGSCGCAGCVCVQVFHVCVWCRVVACVCAASDCRLMRATVTAGVESNAVDLYNSATGAWSTARLSVARWRLAAASVGNVAVFAGGRTGMLF
jgi:hypothetical protein